MSRQATLTFDEALLQVDKTRTATRTATRATGPPVFGADMRSFDRIIFFNPIPPPGSQKDHEHWYCFRNKQVHQALPQRFINHQFDLEVRRKGRNLKIDLDGKKFRRTLYYAAFKVETGKNHCTCTRMVAPRYKSLFLKL
jgi:hypothetical protein